MGQHAVLFIFANVTTADESNFNRWYDREHLSDRIEIPGFTSARRYEGIGDTRWKYLALYEATELQVFTSPIYKERLASQSPWSTQVLPLFVDPQRTIAQEISRCGVGFGCYISIFAFRPDKGAQNELAETFSTLASAAIEADDHLLRMRLLSGDPELSRPVAEYKHARPSPIGGEHWFVFCEASEPLSLASAAAQLSTLPGARDLMEVGAYRLRVGVDSGDADRQLEA